LNPEKKSYVHSLVRPVYSFVYLRTKKKIIRAIPIKAYSRDLECFYESEKTILSVPRKHFLNDGYAGLSKLYFEGNRLDSTQFSSSFFKVKDFDIDGDNFTFKCRYMVEKSPSICHSFELKIFADSGHHELEIFNKGCAQYNFVSPSDLYFGGKFENLTQLTAEAGKWHELEIKVKNKKFAVILDGDEKFKALYNRKMGRLSVLKFRFKGFGKMDYVKMLNAKGDLVENDEY
jgi:hypothetical protein